MYQLINWANSFYGLRETITDEQYNRLTAPDKEQYQKVEVNETDRKAEMGSPSTVRAPVHRSAPKKRARIPELLSILVSRLLSR